MQSSCVGEGVCSILEFYRNAVLCAAFDPRRKVPPEHPFHRFIARGAPASNLDPEPPGREQRGKRCVQRPAGQRGGKQGRTDREHRRLARVRTTVEERRRKKHDGCSACRERCPWDRGGGWLELGGEMGLDGDGGKVRSAARTMLKMDPANNNTMYTHTISNPPMQTTMKVFGDTYRCNGGRAAVLAPKWDRQRRSCSTVGHDFGASRDCGSFDQCRRPSHPCRARQVIVSPGRSVVALERPSPESNTGGELGCEASRASRFGDTHSGYSIRIPTNENNRIFDPHKSILV